MNSLVLGLQNEITRSGCDVVNVLRKAHLISSKLDLAQFDQWTQYELNGYPGPGYCPEYRKVRGVLKALNPYRGWIPTVIQNDDFEKKICERKTVNSISEIISLGKSSDDGWLIYEFSGEQLEYLNSLFKPPVPMTYKLYIPSTSIADIEEKVKNTILDWTLKLEAEGIVGENMVFSEKEKNCAAGIPQTISNFFLEILVLLLRQVTMCKLYLGVKTTLPSRIVLWSRQLTKLRKDYLKKGFQTILQREQMNYCLILEVKLRIKASPMYLNHCWLVSEIS